MIYLKHKHSSKVYIIDSTHEYELDLHSLKETRRNLYGIRTPNRKKDTENYSILSRVQLLKYIQKSNFQISSEVQNLLNVQLKITFQYQLL